MIDTFFNLHERMFSVRSIYGTFHTPAMIVYEPRFVVQPAGRMRVLREKRKNVHAFVRADRNNMYPQPFSRWTGTKDEVEVSYNPYKAGHFFVKALGPKYKVVAGNRARLLTTKDKTPRIFVQGVVIEEA